MRFRRSSVEPGFVEKQLVDADNLAREQGREDDGLTDALRMWHRGGNLVRIWHHASSAWARLAVFGESYDAADIERTRLMYEEGLPGAAETLAAYDGPDRALVADNVDMIRQRLVVAADPDDLADAALALYEVTLLFGAIGATASKDVSVRGEVRHVNDFITTRRAHIGIEARALIAAARWELRQRVVAHTLAWELSNRAKAAALADVRAA